MESEWELERIRLFQIWREHDDWTKAWLGRELKRSLSWVKKWLKRFGEAEQPTLEMFKSHSERHSIDRLKSSELFAMLSSIYAINTIA